MPNNPSRGHNQRSRHTVTLNLYKDMSPEDIMDMLRPAMKQGIREMAKSMAGTTRISELDCLRLLRDAAQAEVERAARLAHPSNPEGG